MLGDICDAVETARGGGSNPKVKNRVCIICPGKGAAGCRAREGTSTNKSQLREGVRRFTYCITVMYPEVPYNCVLHSVGSQLVLEQNLVANEDGVQLEDSVRSDDSDDVVTRFDCDEAGWTTVVSKKVKKARRFKK
jgi:hypothetical protein